MSVRLGWGSFQAHPGVDPGCPRCAGRGYTIQPVGERAVASACVCLKGCPTCRDTGWVRAEAGRTAPMRRCAACQDPPKRLALFNAANIPAKHATSAFETFNHSLAPEVTRAWIATQKWARDFKPGEPNPGLVFYGPVGTGKTHLMVALIRALTLEHGVSARFVEFSLLLQDLRSGFDHGTPTSELIEPLVRVDVLAIDELGKGRNTEWEGIVLDELVSRRYNAMKTLIGTTNFAPKATGTAVPNLAAPRESAAREAGLADRVGERVFSRLHEMVRFEPLITADYRNPAGARARAGG